MLADTITLGTGGAQVVYTKRKAGETESLYTLTGQTTATAFSLKFKYSTDGKSVQRNLLDISQNVIDDVDTNRFHTMRVYANVVRYPGDADGDINNALIRLAAALSDSTLRAQFLAQTR